MLRRITIACVIPICVIAMALFGSPTAQASQTDCMSYAYACTPNYTGANASSTWAWAYYGGSYATTSTGYHNCTLYAAWRLAQNGMANPGRSWGNAASWASNIGGGNHTPVVGSIAWWGTEAGGGYGHVAYVEQVSGSNVYVRADSYSATKGYTAAGWIAASSVDLFLHPHDVGGGGSGGYEVAFQANTSSLWTVGSDNKGAWGLGMMSGTNPSVTALRGGGYEAAFQANTGHLWVVGSAGSGDLGFGMMHGTSPSITALSNGGYEVAFQANTSSLWTVGSDNKGAWGLGMMNGTSPSIVG